MIEVSQSVYEGVYRIPVPLPGNPLKNINDYYIQGRNRNLLVDTAFNLPECRDALNAGLASVGADMGRTDIFLTHLHSDHTGLAADLAGPESRVFIGETDRARMAGMFNPDNWDEAYRWGYLQGFSTEELTSIRIGNPASKYLPSKDIPYIGVQDGEILDLGGFRLRCVETPGHTPGHMCLYEEDRKLLFSGDHILFDISPNITSWPGIPDSLGDYLESLKKVRGMDIAAVLPAHRRLEGNAYARIDELIEHHDRRLEEVRRILARRTQTDSHGCTAYEVASRMTWSIRVHSWTDFPDTQKWFAVGEASAHIDYLSRRGELNVERRGGKDYYRLA